MTLHFVNYGREPGPEGYAGTGIADENPIAVSGVGVDFVVPDASRVVKVDSLSPERPDPQPVEFQVEAGRLRFTMPEFLVYGMARIHLEGAAAFQPPVGGVGGYGSLADSPVPAGD